MCIFLTATTQIFVRFFFHKQNSFLNLNQPGTWFHMEDYSLLRYQNKQALLHMAFNVFYPMWHTQAVRWTGVEKFDVTKVNAGVWC